MDQEDQNKDLGPSDDYMLVFQGDNSWPCTILGYNEDDSYHVRGIAYDHYDIGEVEAINDAYEVANNDVNW